MLSFSLSAQSGYPRDGNFSGNSSSFQTARDSVQKPPLNIRYFEIDELGFLADRRDTIVKRDLAVDLLQGDIHHLRLGNIYSAALPVRAELTKAKGQTLGVDSYNVYRNYQLSGIVTSPNRVMVNGYYGTRFGDGSRNINLDFSRTFARNITLGFRVLSGKSTGQFSHQASNFNTLEFNVVQRSKKDKRRSYAHFEIVKNSEQLNGGLVDPESVFTPLASGNQQYSVNNNDTDFSLKNTYFKLGTSITLGRDSIPSKIKKIAFAEIGSKKERFLHIEPTKGSFEDLAYLPVIFPSNVDTFQRANLDIYQKLGLSLKSSSWEVNSNIQFVQNSVSQKDTTSENRLQFYVNANAKYRIKRFNIEATGFQEIGGLNERNLKLNLDWRSRQHVAQATIESGSEASGIFQREFYLDNNVFWQNDDFLNQNYFNGKLSYANKKTKTEVTLKYETISNFIYLDPSSIYSQALSNITFQSAELKQDLKLAFIRLSNTLFFQNISDRTILDLPRISSRHDLSLSVSFFKKRLKTKIGSLIWFQDASTRPSFHPFLNDFFFPSADQRSQLLRISPYIKADISGLEIFISWDDLERGYYRNRHFFNVTNYPSFDSRINLAFRVRLLD